MNGLAQVGRVHRRRWRRAAADAGTRARAGPARHRGACPRRRRRRRRDRRRPLRARRRHARRRRGRRGASSPSKVCEPPRVRRRRRRDEPVARSTPAAPALVVSQFTLYGDASRGRRPGWSAAAPPELAEPLVDAFTRALASLGRPGRDRPLPRRHAGRAGQRRPRHAPARRRSSGPQPCSSRRTTRYDGTGHAPGRRLGRRLPDADAHAGRRCEPPSRRRPLDLSGLNPAQHEAVTLPAGPVLVDRRRRVRARPGCSRTASRT